MSVLAESLTAMDAILQSAVQECIQENNWTLEDYLRYLDEGNFVYKTRDELVKIEFREDHRVTGKLIGMPTGQFHWNFIHPVEAEVSWLFEDILDQ
jgi:hypothetical protein